MKKTAKKLTLFALILGLSAALTGISLAVTGDLGFKDVPELRGDDTIPPVPQSYIGVEGFVHDQDGDPVNNAEVTIELPEGEVRSVVTNPRGHYVITPTLAVPGLSRARAKKLIFEGEEVLFTVKPGINRLNLNVDTNLAVESREDILPPSL